METAGAGSKRGEETTLPEPDAAESALVARARAGERVALEEIVRLHAGTVYRIVAGYVPRDEAEDATQEVFVRIQQGLPAFEGRSRLATWIHRIATNVGLRRIRTRRRKPPPHSIDGVDAAAPGASPLDATSDEELREAFRLALDALPGEQRAVVVLRGIEGLPFEDVASALGIPLPTAHSRMARACERLRRILQRFVDPERTAHEPR
ncbi:MAG TPA: sigma-70 family RNA polymerase sigma factor [Planctomycetota bacterium]|nr:sigma-70 family RNA polymerase sigma factor [Planctomycetota bacterium]